MRNLYLLGEIRCVSPIAIGSGVGELTDRDVLLDPQGSPFIPGATLAGVFRHFLAALDQGAFNAAVNDLFGAFSDEDGESRITFYDAFAEGSFRRTFRDGVRIGDDGTAEDTGKFDYEVVEPTDEKSFFRFRVLVEDCTETDVVLLKKAVAAVNAGLIRVGFKTNRGLGKLSLTGVCQKEVTDAAAWIGFTWDQVTDSFAADDAPEGETFTYTFENTAFLTVANNATLLCKSDGGFINAEPVKNAHENAVIPGASWAGVFRHHFRRILRRADYFHGDEKALDAFLDRLFGSTEFASRLVFDESELHGALLMQQTRNAVDRFTGGASDKKLFTNQLAYGGSLTLRITLRPGLPEETAALARELIALTVADLNDGALNVGAMGGVGGGILRLKQEESI